MNAQEAAVLCRACKAVCPQQKFDEMTPDFWHSLLDDVDFEAAKRALITVAKRQPFVSPSEIRAEVSRERNRLSMELGALQPPAHIEAIEDPDEFDRAYRAWLGATRDAIAAGKPIPTDAPAPLAIEATQVDEAVESIRRSFARPKALPSRMPREVRRIPSRWAADRGLQVVDPHNWDGDFRAQITEAEFDERVGGVMTKPFEPITEPVEMPPAAIRDELTPPTKHAEENEHA